MSEHYSHLLIPHHPNFVPTPAQVSAFHKGLSDLGTTPREAKIRLGRQLGKVLTGTNHTTGEEIIVPRRDFEPLNNPDQIPTALIGLNDYYLEISGKGPAQYPPFKLYLASDPKWRSEITSEYFYAVIFNFREASVSMSEPGFLKPCGSPSNNGISRNPWNTSVIKVPNAACTRFWIEFMFGNWLVPKIERSLDLLPSEIPQLATESFGVGFAQGGVFS